jgi:hypothetical protein
MESNQALKPRFVLPSFKDVQQRGSEKSRLQSAFQQGAAKPASAQCQAQPSSGNPPGLSGKELPAANRTNGAVCERAAFAQAGLSAQHSNVRNTTPTAAALNALPDPSDGSTRPQQLREWNNRASVPNAPGITPLQPSNRAPVASTAYSAQIRSGNAILVNHNQQGNSILKHIRNVNYRFADIVPDFQFNDQVCQLVLNAGTSQCVATCLLLCISAHVFLLL